MSVKSCKLDKISQSAYKTPLEKVNFCNGEKKIFTQAPQATFLASL